jgi:hypothetical protein
VAGHHQEFVTAHAHDEIRARNRVAQATGDAA